MKIRISIIAAITGCLLLASGAVLAVSSEEITTPSASAGNYVKFAIGGHYDGAYPVPLPNPGEEDMNSNSVPGPIATTDGSTVNSRGSAIVGPRGGSFMTPKRRADREIQQLINTLD
jgi:hypothetical protein